jgi:hypothetical protein
MIHSFSLPTYPTGTRTLLRPTGTVVAESRTSIASEQQTATRSALTNTACSIGREDSRGRLCATPILQYIYHDGYIQEGR